MSTKISNWQKDKSNRRRKRNSLIVFMKTSVCETEKEPRRVLSLLPLSRESLSLYSKSLQTQVKRRAWELKELAVLSSRRSLVKRSARFWDLHPFSLARWVDREGSKSWANLWMIFELLKNKKWHSSLLWLVLGGQAKKKKPPKHVRETLCLFGANAKWFLVLLWLNLIYSSAFFCLAR